MSKQQGEIPFPYQVQPNRTIIERDDGTLEGTVDFVTKVEWSALLPQIDDTHPDDLRLELHTREITVSTHGLVTMTGSFLGLRDDPTDPIISYVGSPDREDIRTHPDFTTKLAGSAASPKNVSRWVQYKTGEPTTQIEGSEFHSFGTNATAVSSLLGVQFFLKASTQVETTWWQTKVPTIKRMIIVDNIKPFKKPDDVKNFLIVDTPYRQIGNHYQVTQIALGSGSGGWSELLYPQP